MLSTGTVTGSPSAGYSLSPRGASLAPMLPPSSAGAALNEYSATPPSQRTRTLLEKGYYFGIAIEPSPIPSAPS